MNRIVLSLRLSFLIISTILGGLLLPHSVTSIQAQSPQLSIKDQNIMSLDVTDAAYNANTSKHLGSRNITLTPYRMTEERFSEQGFLRGVGNVTNNQTITNTYLSDNFSRVEEMERLRLPMAKLSIGYPPT